MSEKAGLGKIAIAIFFTAIIIEIWLIIGNGQLLSVVMDIWEKGKTQVSGITENDATSNILMKDDSCEYSDSDQKYYGKVLRSEISRDSIVTVTFLNTLDAMTDNAWDVSQEQNGTVMAWTEPNVSKEQARDLFIGAEGKIVAEDCSGLFQGFYNVEAIEFNNCFDTSRVTDMGSMFSECERLIQLDVSNFDTSRVTDMSGMFGGCESLAQLDVSQFDTSRVVDMSVMFQECASLTQLDVSGFDTGQVTGMSGMFNGCRSLRQLDVGNFDTSQVAAMKGMFCDCKSLAGLDVSSFDTSRVTNMSLMFLQCENLTHLDVSNFDTSQVADMWGMFSGCRSLTQLDVSNFDTSHVIDMHWMFSGCESLTQLDVSNFDMSQVLNDGNMFEGCGVTAEEANFRMQ